MNFIFIVPSNLICKIYVAKIFKIICDAHPQKQINPLVYNLSRTFLQINAINHNYLCTVQCTLFSVLHLYFSGSM